MEQYYLAIDLGGTNTKIGLVEKTHGLVQQKNVSTVVSEGPARAVDLWLQAAQEWTTAYKIQACGIGSPGPLDTKTGKIEETPNLPGWGGYSFTDAISSRLKIPCYFDKDATVACLGEWKYGSGRGLDHIIVVTLGTGIGSGVITHGQLLTGSRGFAPEIGHMVINFDGPRCNCGRNGCLEAYTGAIATVRRYQEVSQTSSETITIKDIFQRAQSGESAATLITNQWIHALAVGIGSMINIFNPQRVILTGGVSKAWTYVEKDFQKILLNEAFASSVKCVEVVQSQLGNDSALLGAAYLAQIGTH